MKKLKNLFILLLAGLFLFSSCVKDAGDSTTSADGTELYINLTNKTVSEDNEEYFELSDENTMLIGNTVKVSLNSAGIIKVDYTSERAYDTNIHLSGSLTGGVKIQTNGEEGVNTAVYLNNVTITSTDYPCLEITKGGAATVYLSGSNTFTDGRIYGYGYGDSAATCAEGRAKNAEGSDNKGTLYCKGSLTIAESSSGGALTVIQAYKNCIATKDGLLTVKSGSLNLKNFHGENSGKNGLYGGTGIVIEGGSISFEGNGVVSASDLRKANGLKTDDQDGTNTTNYINISGGSISISIEDGKGISASNVNISGGSVKVLVSGEENDSQTSYSCYDADGVQESGTIKYNPKGIEGEEAIKISGGNVFVNSSKTGIDTDK
ncbi:MAG: carbohydrate-binding domain-containing protein, partial [Treponema sp.]|nr:carbohydrate-binding domain-containing protein [Treponema sp.]